MLPIPHTLAPFFQEYEFSKLSPQKDSHTIIERTLQFGNRSEIHWLFTVYSREQITAWIRQFGKDKLPQPHRAFWQIILEISDGYGFPLIAPMIESEGIRLASVEDIALMKLDAMLSRAARKDFYDLYFICKKIPLPQLFEKAPQKYPSVRDFEAQTTKRLVYFENAENESEPSLIESVSWQTVKEYFIEQVKEIERSWLK
ncbi:MAG: nucleotidyl transferase AbiEii/AbiGii toxin family protein [Anaerolineales bacterium]|nr:nucleotidyl transferase AbiEii/AbiGii toxin family protein [Anaerolineales bacterium]